MCRSPNPSTLTKAVGTGASTVLHDPRMLIGICPQGWILSRISCGRKTRHTCFERSYRKKATSAKPIALGSNTDPYQPAEKNFRITRSILEVLQEFHHPFTIVTKSSLILRDLDILSDMALKQLCSVHISVTTLDNELKRKLEPRTASPAARLSTLQAPAQSGIPSGVLVAPIIPKINDHELEHILAEAQSHGASTAGYIFIRLPHEVAPLFQSGCKPITLSKPHM